jgi:hypothetical protein
VWDFFQRIARSLSKQCINFTFVALKNRFSLTAKEFLLKNTSDKVLG